jgi:hypothetical protein
MSLARFFLRSTAALLLLIVVLAACRPGEVLPAGGNPIPTPRAGDLVPAVAESQAAASPDETVNRYLTDSIAMQLKAQSTKIEVRQRYQEPGQTTADLGGLVTGIAVLENRTVVTTPKEIMALAHVDMDVRLTFANGDTDSRTCKYDVTLQRYANAKGDNVWYVINPNLFPFDSQCRP